jgi:hypothetical protein
MGAPNIRADTQVRPYKKLLFDGTLIFSRFQAPLRQTNY